MVRTTLFWRFQKDWNNRRFRDDDVHWIFSKSPYSTNREHHFSLDYKSNKSGNQPSLTLSDFFTFRLLFWEISCTLWWKLLDSWDLDRRCTYPSVVSRDRIKEKRFFQVPINNSCLSRDKRVDRVPFPSPTLPHFFPTRRNVIPSSQCSFREPLMQVYSFK